MKTKILSNVPVSIIVFFLLVTTPFLGCLVTYQGEQKLVSKLDPVILTSNDLLTMRLTEINNIGRTAMESHRTGGPPAVIVGLEQRWERRQLTVRYWLYNAADTAKEGGAAGHPWTYAAWANFHPELNPDHVIGDATWRVIPSRRRERNMTDLWFVKNNVLVHVRTSVHPPNELQVARDVARKIAAKIEAVLEEK